MTEEKMAPGGITRITVAGYKSISQEQSIEVRPLTILAGANSSGKSSIMQPLLLLKQTLEATYDPGPLLLNGPNAKFTSADQFLSWVSRGDRADVFHVAVEVGSDSVTTCFTKQADKRLEVKQTTYISDREKLVLCPGMTRDEITAVIPTSLKDVYKLLYGEGKEPDWVIVRNRCFLEPGLWAKDSETKPLVVGTSPGMIVIPCVHQLIHLPGLRGNPERTYPVTAVGLTFPGTFENYVASVITQWQADEDDKLIWLREDLKTLDLTWKVTARPINDTQVELRIGRLTRAVRGGARDLVNIADVGFGVSQTLPVLVALRVAEPGQLVYLEQPEIHLHPNAQLALAQVLADAASRGVRVVAETHSALLLLGIQTLIAEGKLDPTKVKLHWFTRRKDGATEITSTDLDEAGAFGDWPEDFAAVALQAESRYLDAAESRQGKH